MVMDVTIIGGGPRGYRWYETISESHGYRLLQVVEPDPTASERWSSVEVPVVRNLDMAQTTGSELCIDATPPFARAESTRFALTHGWPTIAEKPLAPSLGVAEDLICISQKTGSPLLVACDRLISKGFRSLLEECGHDRIQRIHVQLRRSYPPLGHRVAFTNAFISDLGPHIISMGRAIAKSSVLEVSAVETDQPRITHVSITFTNGIEFTIDGSLESADRHTTWMGQWHVQTDQGQITWDGSTAVTRRTTSGVFETFTPRADRTSGPRLCLEEMVAALSGDASPLDAVNFVEDVAVIDAMYRSIDAQSSAAVHDV